MGMAASQARYLALSARKTNVEYEGQQINQQRLMLSNQSADLFNQMLTMSVPTPPSSSEFTKLQYSWNDGINTSVLEDYYQIGTANSDYNYVVTSYHYEDVYTGQRKFLKDPQIQATKTNHFSNKKATNYTVSTISYNNDKDTYSFKLINAMGNEISKTFKPAAQKTDKDTVEMLDYLYNRTTDVILEPGKTHFVINNNDTISYYADGDPTGTAVTYQKVDTNDRNEMDKLIQSYGAFYDKSHTYYKNGTTYICEEEIGEATALTPVHGTIKIRNLDQTQYYTDGTDYISSTVLANLKAGDTMTVTTAQNDPTFSDYKAIGNCELVMVDDKTYNEDITIKTAIAQIIEDMEKSDGDQISWQRLKKCFDDNNNYIGGLYQFKMNGKIYYTTTEDLDDSLLSAYQENSTANNSIDSQQTKLSYYNAVYIETKVTEVKNALLETDGKGRFSTVKFEDDSVVYDLNVETITDDKAYDDAMNQYYYKQEQYDQEVTRINARTKVLQAQDRQLELKLEQLNTEQSALQTEMEACQKVVSKHIDNGFKAFSG